MTVAISCCATRLDAAELLWETASRAHAEANRLSSLASAETDPSTRARLEKEHAVEIERARTLVESALVRAITAWEVFLRDLVDEYITIWPKAFENARGLTGPPDKMMALIEEGYPFQSPEKAAKIIDKYVGKGVLSSAPQQQMEAVRQAIAARNAIVHAAGNATAAFQRTCHPTLSPYEWLRSPPRLRAVPASEFERLVWAIRATAAAVDAAVWALPTPT